MYHSRLELRELQRFTAHRAPALFEKTLSIHHLPCTQRHSSSHGMMKEKALTNISMSESRAPELGINSWLEDELYQQYLNNRKNVDESWKEVFETNGGSTSEAPAAAPDLASANGSHPPQQQGVAVQNGEAPAQTLTVPEHHPVAGETLIPLRGAAARIAENMNLSLSIPLATSQRVMPVKVIDENRSSFASFATALRTVGEQMLKAIDAKNPNDLMEAGAALDEVCESCHLKFWYPGQKIPRFPDEAPEIR